VRNPTEIQPAQLELRLLRNDDIRRSRGISEFQQIVSQGISDSYLRWQGIEATLQLAQSSNSKIVIVGTGNDGLPVILGNPDAASWPQPGNEESAPKEITTAATPAITAEKIPADTLLKPSKDVLCG
jgi:hypothetical protein